MKPWGTTVLNNLRGIRDGEAPRRAVVVEGDADADGRGLICFREVECPIHQLLLMYTARAGALRIHAAFSRYLVLLLRGLDCLRRVFRLNIITGGCASALGTSRRRRYLCRAVYIIINI